MMPVDRLGDRLGEFPVPLRPVKPVGEFLWRHHLAGDVGAQQRRGPAVARVVGLAGLVVDFDKACRHQRAKPHPPQHKVARGYHRNATSPLPRANPSIAPAIPPSSTSSVTSRPLIACRLLSPAAGGAPSGRRGTAPHTPTRRRERRVRTSASAPPRRHAGKSPAPISRVRRS